MLNQHQIQLLPERIYKHLADINTEYLVSVGEVLKEIGELRPTDVHQLQQMYNYGARADEIANRLAETSKKDIAEIYDIFDIVAKENYKFAKPFYEVRNIDYIPYEENIPLQRKVKAMAKQTVDEYVNMTQHTAFAIFDKDGKSLAPLYEKNANKIATSLSDTYTKVVDYAVTQVNFGKAVKDIIKTMSASGIRTVDYATGYSRRLDTAVRQNVLWGVKECNQQVANLVGEEFGANGMEVDYHMHPRPGHEIIGGRQFALNEVGIVIDGVFYPSFYKVANPLLEEYGCLHFSFPILLGISRPAYTEEELAEYAKADNITFEFEGKKYTMYEGTQLQRKVETALRHQRDILNMAKAAGEGDTELIARSKIRMLTDKYVELSEVSGLPTQMERTKSAIAVSNEKGINNKRTHNTVENKVNFPMLSTKEYKEKFNNIPCCKETQQTIYEQSKAILTHRNGTYFEDICLIDVNTGKIIVTSYNNKTENEVIYSLKAQKAIKENKNALIAIHNHGTNNPPTGSDFVSAGSKQYAGGIVACHNGDVYYYKVGKKAFSSDGFSKMVDNFMKKGYNEKKAIKETLAYYVKEYGIEWRQL